jgi:hypothetical protein
MVIVEARIDERGCVTSVCVVKGVDAAYDKALARHVKTAWFHPARLAGRPVATLITLPFHVTRQPAGSSRVSRSTDVQLLQMVVRSPADVAGHARGADWQGNPATWRTDAYARLGNLATKESLAAVRRIETELKTMAPALSTPSPLQRSRYDNFRSIVQARAGDGITYAIARGGLAGIDLLLLSTRNPSDATAWSRPKLLPVLLDRSTEITSLSSPAVGTLRLTLDEPGAFRNRAGFSRRTLDFRVVDIERDSDNDGWTDVEEQRLGLDPRNPDSDGDGVPDGKDVCPNYAPTQADRDDESVAIIQKAFLAVAGLNASRTVLYPRPAARKVQLWGARVPVIYGFDRADPSAREDRTRYREVIDWRVVRTGHDTATVRMATLFSGHDVYLQKFDGEWFVVAWELVWQAEPAL